MRPIPSEAKQVSQGYHTVRRISQDPQRKTRRHIQVMLGIKNGSRKWLHSLFHNKIPIKSACSGEMHHGRVATKWMLSRASFFEIQDLYEVSFPFISPSSFPKFFMSLNVSGFVSSFLKIHIISPRRRHQLES